MSADTGIRLLYVTTASDVEAQAIAETTVRERLAACANILPGMRSLYWWQGKIERGEECVLILKTRLELVPALTERVKALHSYSVPCVLEIAVASGNVDYINWLLQEAKPA